LFGRQHNEVSSVLERMHRTLDQLERRAERMETILLVREPTSMVAADAYEGLRKQVVSAVSERHGHLSQLVEIDHALRHGADPIVLRSFVDAWFEQANLLRISDPAGPDADLAFELIEDGDGPLEVVEPAYADGTTGRLVRRGRVRRAGRPLPSPRHQAPAVGRAVADAAVGRAANEAAAGRAANEAAAGRAANEAAAGRAANEAAVAAGGGEAS